MPIDHNQFENCAIFLVIIKLSFEHSHSRGEIWMLSHLFKLAIC